MNSITITFNHPEAVAPKYIFNDRIAVQSDCQPEAWATGLVVGLHLEEIFSPRWWYICKLDSPLGLTEEYLDSDLVAEANIPKLQAECEAAWKREEQEPEPESVEDCPRCEGTGYVYSGFSGQSDTCSSCAATGIKNDAKTLPPASMKRGKPMSGSGLLGRFPSPTHL